MGSAPGRRSRRSRRRSQVQSRKWGKLKREQQRETGMGWAGQGLGHAGDNVQRQTIFIFPLSPQGLLGEYVEEEEGAPRQCRKYFICHALPSTARIFRLNWFKKCNSIWISFDIWHQPIPSTHSPFAWCTVKPVWKMSLRSIRIRTQSSQSIPGQRPYVSGIYMYV